MAAVVGGGEGEPEAVVVELVAPEEDPVGPRWAPPERERITAWPLNLWENNLFYTERGCLSVARF